MNYEIYKDLILPFIECKTRQILIQRELWIIGYKRRLFNRNYFNLFLDILIHLGCPCYKYCVCKLFSIHLKYKKITCKVNDFNYEYYL